MCEQEACVNKWEILNHSIKRAAGMRAQPLYCLLPLSFLTGVPVDEALRMPDTDHSAPADYKVTSSPARL